MSAEPDEDVAEPVRVETEDGEEDAARPWWVYVLSNERRHCTYVGATVDPQRRLRQHNGEIVGGARYTTSRAPGWSIDAVVGPLDKINCLRLEWRVKHATRRRRGRRGRRQLRGSPRTRRHAALVSVLTTPAERSWTRAAPPAGTLPLTLRWHQPPRVPQRRLPDWVTEVLPDENDLS
jgi:predicted GIY-YIG superfamily endonuclease